VKAVLKDHNNRNYSTILATIPLVTIEITSEMWPFKTGWSFKTGGLSRGILGFELMVFNTTFNNISVKYRDGQC